MHVQNPNNMELPVKGIDYTLLLMGDLFAEGKTNEPFVLPALGEAEFDMTVTTNFVSSLGRLISRVGGGKLEDIDYELAGTLFVDKGMVRKIPVQQARHAGFHSSDRQGEVGNDLSGHPARQERGWSGVLGGLQAGVQPLILDDGALPRKILAHSVRDDLAPEIGPFRTIRARVSIAQLSPPASKSLNTIPVPSPDSGS